MKIFSFLPLFSSCVLLLASCESERHVYELGGDEVKERKAGESVSLEDRFTGTFDVRKSGAGLGEAKSNKVSSFQSKIDDARGKESSIMGKSFATGSASDMRNKSFSGGNMTFAGSKELGDRNVSVFTTDNVPEFMKPGKGLTRKGYSRADDASSAMGKAYYEAGSEFTAKMSSTSTQKESGYFETRRDRTPDPSIMTKDEYTKMTLDETRHFIRSHKDKAPAEPQEQAVDNQSVPSEEDALAPL